jgi:eukaryotic-like serine/threonine-protein kinase
MTLKTFSDLSIRFKLFLVVFISFWLVLSIVSWLIGIEAQRVAKTEMNKTLVQTGFVLKESWRNRFDVIANVGQGIARDQRIAPLVIDKDKLSVQDIAMELIEGADLDILIFVDDQGQVLGRTDKPEKVGTKLRGNHHLIDTALTGKESRGFMVTQNKLYQVVSQPIYDPDSNAKDIIRGAVVVAFQLSEEIVDRLQRLTDSKISLYAFSRNKQGEVKPKLQVMEIGELRTALEGTQQVIFDKVKTSLDSDVNAPILIELMDEEYYVAVYALEKSGGGVLGYVLALKPQQELIKPFEQIREKILLMGFICFLGAVGLAWILSGRIIKPVNKLIQVTARIEQGQYVPTANRKFKGDELGRLLKSIYQMGNRLKDNEDLERYLSDISEGILDDEYNRGLSKELEHEMGFSGRHIKQDDVVNIPVKNSAPDPDMEMTAVIGGGGDSENKSGRICVGQPFANGRFNVLKEIGTGGMGAVYLAHDTGLNEDVALKVLYELDESKQELLKNEIRLARKITARNVLRTYDYGVTSDQIYISMEYVHGFDLYTLLQRTGGKIQNLRLGVILARQMASAVAAAHEEGIVHRDISPRNMMISSKGLLKVMDFGLAIQVDNSGDNQSIVGTPIYMAPEQIRRETLDERTDIYQLGAVFYRVFSGQTPFVEADMTMLLDAHLTKAVPKLSERFPDIPSEIDHIIQKAMEKNPSMRYQNIQDMQADLQELYI